MKDIRKLKKVEELVQRFSDLCRHYAPKQNIPNLFEIKYEEDIEKGKRKSVVCTNLEKVSAKCGIAWWVGKNAGKNTTHTKMAYGWVSMFHIFISD